MSFAKFRTIDTWVFDLDHTLYPPSVNLFAQIEDKMRNFVSDFLSVDLAKADQLRAQYWASHGTTLAGMMDHHAMPPEEFLIDVHDIDFSVVPKADRLAGLIGALPGRKIVYTNGTEPYARQVLNARGLSHLFDDVFGIEHANYVPKPEVRAFQQVFEIANLTPPSSAMFEDDQRNLRVPFDLGMQTIWIDPDAVIRDHILHADTDLQLFLERLVPQAFPQHFDTLN